VQCTASKEAEIPNFDDLPFWFEFESRKFVGPVKTSLSIEHKMQNDFDKQNRNQDPQWRQLQILLKRHPVDQGSRKTPNAQDRDHFPQCDFRVLIERETRIRGVDSDRLDRTLNELPSLDDFDALRDYPVFPTIRK
jgi:hypothetical protein